MTTGAYLFIDKKLLVKKEEKNTRQPSSFSKDIMIKRDIDPSSMAFDMFDPSPEMLEKIITLSGMTLKPGQRLGFGKVEVEPLMMSSLEKKGKRDLAFDQGGRRRGIETTFVNLLFSLNQLDEDLMNEYLEGVKRSRQIHALENPGGASPSKTNSRSIL